MGISELIADKKEQILSIAGEYGASNVRIFGSVARGTADANSDIDFLVDMERGRSLFDIGGLLFDLEKLLNHRVDVITPGSLKPRIKDRVIKEAIAL